MNIGDKLPSLAYTATNEVTGNLQNTHGKWLVIYFYPKDATPGCTTEGQNFRDAYKKFNQLHCDILGVSRDSLSSHDKFKCQQEFPFELISDEKETLCQAFDVIKMKSMYGKQVRGIERSTFIIDPKGVLRHAWRKVKVPGHVDDVLQTLKSLQQ